MSQGLRFRAYCEPGGARGCRCEGRMESIVHDRGDGPQREARSRDTCFRDATAKHRRGRAAVEIQVLCQAGTSGRGRDRRDVQSQADKYVKPRGEAGHVEADARPRKVTGGGGRDGRGAKAFGRAVSSAFARTDTGRRKGKIAERQSRRNGRWKRTSRTVGKI